MAWLLLLGWLVLLAVLWAWTAVALRAAMAAGGVERMRRLGVALLAAVPPTVVFLVTAFVLLQAAPTVQFNAGDEWGMRLWSFWVRGWQPLYRASQLQVLGYIVWFAGCVVARTRRSTRHAVGFAVLASACGCYVLSLAFPSA